MKVQFITPNVINPLSWSLVGISAKPNSNNPIGKFGTGLKYAIAICVRNKWPIKVITKTNHKVQEYAFSSVSEDFRGNNHEIITCNDAKLPYTTHYGNHWADWTVLRELYSNAVDENGYMKINDIVDVPNNSTVFVVDSADVAELAENIEDYILGERSKQAIVYENDSMAILDERYASKIFYKNILVGNIPSCKFGYNIFSEVKLTEDRTFSSNYEIERIITKSILTGEFDSALENFMLAGSYTENTFYTPDWIDLSESMQNALVRLNASNPHTLLNCLKIYLPKEEKNKYNEVEFSLVERKMLDAAIKSMKVCSLPIVENIVKVEVEDNELIAFVDSKDKSCVYLTDKAFRNQDYLIATLMEEFSHCRGYFDESRQYEEYLCETIAKLVWLTNNQ
jgi:hypothetical protein